MKKLLIPLIILAIVLLALLSMKFLNQKSTNIEPATEKNEEKLTLTTDIECSGVQIPELTEGPYYTENSPEKTNLLEDGIPGTKLTISGFVLDTNCQPVANAWLDFWQTDGEGQYDNSGYKLRGHQYTDKNGKYTLTTVIPGEYPGRTQHIHVKVKANDNMNVLTTQLFIPGSAKNSTDSIYNDQLLIDVKDANDGKEATFNFVIKT